MSARRTGGVSQTGDGAVVAAIVGIDGCGKTSTWHGAVKQVAHSVRTAGVGDDVLAGAPGEPVRARTDVPLSRSARAVGALAKGLRRPTLYKDLKFLEFVERTHVRNYLLAHDPPVALLTDGDPLVNMVSWSAARYAREALAEDDRMVDVVHYMTGERRIPVRELPYYLRHGWQLVVANRLHVARFALPDLVFHLHIDPAVAMDRIRARNRPLQVHENEGFLGVLGDAYERVCSLLETQCGVPVVRIRVDETTHEQTVRIVSEAVLAHATEVREVTRNGPLRPDTIEVVATTMSGSFEDQRKVRAIEEAFRFVTDRPVRVHPVDSHAEARRIAQGIVAGGGRTVVSAGGAGTFNAVVEGCHVGGAVPADLRLAFLRKGSADLIGKVLHVPDDLPGAAAGIAAGIAADDVVAADVLAVETVEPDGDGQCRHLVGFGGFGVFGEVPRFTESRIIKVYKGLLGTMFGDLGPFYVGLVLAGLWWWVRRVLGRLSPLELSLDGETLPAERWVAVIVLNGDLGQDFPLGRGVDLASGTFRVVALRYRGVRSMLRQIGACRSAVLLDHPERFAATVREVRSLVVRTTRPCPPFMVNVDGLRLVTSGTVRITVSGRASLIDAAKVVPQRGRHPSRANLSDSADRPASGEPGADAGARAARP